MKSKKTIVAVTLIMLLSLVITGCGCSGKTNTTANNTTNNTNTTNSTTQDMDNADKAQLIGKWNVVSVTSGGKTYSGDDVSGSFEFKEDGTLIQHGGVELYGTWQLSNGNVTLSFRDDYGTVTCQGKLDGTVLTLDEKTSYGSSGTYVVSKV